MNHQLLMYMFDESISFSTHLWGLLLAGRPWISHERRNTHENAKKYKMKRRRGERRRRVQTDTPCAKYFRSWKAERGEKKKKKPHYPWKHATRGDEGLCFASDRFLSRAGSVLSKARLNSDDRQHLSLRLKDFSRLATDSEIILISSLIYFYNLRTLKKRVNKAVSGGEDEEDNFRKHAALHNSKISSRIHLSFPRHRRANFFWSSSFIFGLWLSRYKYLIKTLFFIITRNDRKINYNLAKFLSAECEREISVLCNVWESSEVRVKCADIAEIRAHGVGKSRTSEKFFASRPGD